MTNITLIGMNTAATTVGGEEISITPKTKDAVPPLCREMIRRGLDPQGIVRVTRNGKPVWRTDRTLGYWAGLAITEEDRDGLRWGKFRHG